MSSFAVALARKAKTIVKGQFLAVFHPQATVNAVVLTLQLFEKVAEHVPFPGIKTAVGSLLAVIQQLEVRTTAQLLSAQPVIF